MGECLLFSTPFSLLTRDYVLQSAPARLSAIATLLSVELLPLSKLTVIAEQ